MTTSLAARSVHDPGSVPATPVADLFDEHCAFVCRVLRHHGVDDATLDDAVQDVFVTAHRRWSTFEGRSTARSWLYGIARRIAFRYRRSASTRARHLVTVDEPAEGIDDPFARAHAARSLEALLQRIDRDKRTVFVLSELEGMTAPEIADALQLPVGTVYSRLRAAWKGLGREAERERQRLHRVHRHLGDPSPERRRRMWGLVMGGLRPRSLAPVVGGVGWLAQIKWFVVGGAVGAGLIAARLAMVDPSPDPPPSSSPPPITAATPAKPSPDHGSTDETPTPPRSPRAEPPPLPAELPPSPAPPQITPRPQPVPAGSPDALALELELLREAKQAIREDRADDALALLDRHARRFPRGQLTDERRATRLRALCAASRTAEAARQAAALGRDPARACSS